MRIKVSIVVLAVISLLAIHSHQLLRGANTPEGRSGTDGSRTPVLIELFTSEGCSDCPPADALLQKLDRTQPVDGAELIVLSEHVDYWNDDGWRDPYSSHEYSERQGNYASQLGLRDVYTPQMVVDGRFELVGSNETQAILAAQNATRAEKIPVSISAIHLGAGNMVTMHVDAGELPRSMTARSADVLIATADESDESRVSSGENARRTLKHVAVLRSLTRNGTVDRSGGFSRDISVNVNPSSGGNLRVVAIVQEPATGKVLGVGAAHISK